MALRQKALPFLPFKHQPGPAHAAASPAAASSVMPRVYLLLGCCRWTVGSAVADQVSGARGASGFAGE